MSDEIREHVGDEPYATFGCTRATDTEVVGPIATDGVDYGHWTWNFHGVFPMIVLHFNKYNAHLPPWDSVIEVVLASEDGVATANVASHLDTKVSGTLKTLSLGAHDVRVGVVGGTIVSREDVLRSPPDASQSKSDFRVTEDLQ